MTIDWQIADENLKGSRRYLGDAVYASYDGYHVWLETCDGNEVIDKIALDYHVASVLFNYLQSISMDGT